MMLCAGAFSCSNDDEPWAEEEFSTLARTKMTRSAENNPTIIHRKVKNGDVCFMINGVDTLDPVSIEYYVTYYSDNDDRNVVEDLKCSCDSYKGLSLVHTYFMASSNILRVRLLLGTKVLGHGDSIYTAVITNQINF